MTWYPAEYEQFLPHTQTTRAGQPPSVWELDRDKPRHTKTKEPCPGAPE